MTSSYNETYQDRPLCDLHIVALDDQGRPGLGQLELGDPNGYVILQAPREAWMAPGDLIELLCGDNVIAQFPVADDGTDTLDLSVEAALFPDGPVLAELSWRVIPQPYQSSPRQVWIKRKPPGGSDPAPNGLEGQNENLPAIRGVPKLVSEAQDLHLNVPPWPEMHEGDELILFWGSLDHVIRNPPLLASQVGQVQTIVADAATLLAVGNSDALTVCYSIDDRVKNWSQYSLQVQTKVQLAQTTLDAPSILQADPISGDLDPAQLPASGADVFVSPYSGKAFGDVITLIAQGAGKGGLPLNHSEDWYVGADEAYYDTQFTLPSGFLYNLAGTLTLSYRVQSMSGGTKNSATVTYNIVAQANLPKASVDNVQSDVFDPNAYPNGTVVRINGSSAGLKRQDRVILSWRGVAGAGTSSKELLVSADKQNLSWPISKALIDANRNQTVEVLYEVVRTTGGRQVSPALVLGIGIKPSQPLSVDSSEMKLDGPMVLGLAHYIPSGVDVPGNTAMRAAQGGTPPYTYSSSNPRVASVNEYGKVSGNTNGTASISIRDAANRVLSYSVQVSNVRQLVCNISRTSFAQAESWMLGISGVPLGENDLKQLVTRYKSPFTITKSTATSYWTCAPQVAGMTTYLREQIPYALRNISVKSTEVTAALCVVNT